MKKVVAFTIAMIGALLWFTAQSQRQDYKNPAGKEFPILAWYSIFPDSLHTPHRYAELRDAGFNLSFSHASDPEVMRHSLDAATNSGVGVMLWAHNGELTATEVAKRFKSHPSLAAYFIIDEPSAKAYEGLRQKRDSILAVDSEHLVYVNLFPNLLTPKQLDSKDYEDYVRRIVTDVEIGFISYDHYPVLTDSLGQTLFRPEFYDNLETVAKVAGEENVPFWAFVLSSSHEPYPVPTMAHMTLEAFAALAYGAQGMQYFTYYRPFEHFHQCPLDTNGKRTNTWYMVQQLNREIQALSPVFLGAKVLNVGHTGLEIPKGTQRLSSLPHPIKSVESDGEGILVSHMVNGKDHYLVIVNRDIEHSQTVKVDKGKNVKRVKPFVKPFTDNDAAVEVAPGGYLIYTWHP